MLNLLPSRLPEFLQKTWIHVPSLMFIVFNVPPYSFTTRNLYKLAEAKVKLLFFTYFADLLRFTKEICE